MNAASLKISTIDADYRLATETGQKAVLRTLAYFDLFQYPLQLTEIRQYLGYFAGEECVHRWLTELERIGLVFSYTGFYLLRNDPTLCERRLKGNAEAEKLLAKAKRIGRFLYQFPFVRGVGISGSLSKNFAGENADIDFFIITRANRIWIARTLMHLFKKLTFLTGRQHYYCMNYFIDESALRLDDRNIFTAIELKTLLPVCGDTIMPDFFACNPWADDHLPMSGFRTQEQKDPNGNWLKKTGERLLSGKTGNRFESFFMRLTQRRWNRKEERGKRNDKGLTMGLISGKHFARSNPGGFQEKLLNAYRLRVTELEKAHAAQAALILSF